jgi:hypothetical protein
MILSIVILLGIMLVGGYGLKSDFQSPRLYINETPIVKNTDFQLKSGELYEYAYTINGTRTNITYEIVDSNDCTEIRITNGMGKSSVCVDQNGVDKKLNSNATLSDPSFLIFKPWMLALSYNWKWNNTIYMNFNNQLSKMSTNSYHVMRTDRYRGRDVFVVRESDENQITQYEWVDMKKRIVLKSVGPGYQLELINGLEFVDNN